MAKSQELHRKTSADSWREKVESGSIFKTLKTTEARDEKSRQLARQREFSSIVSPNPKQEVKKVSSVEAAAQGRQAAGSKGQLDDMEALIGTKMARSRSIEAARVKQIGLGGKPLDMAALRAHAEANEPKLAGRHNKADFRSPVPPMDKHVVALEKYVGATAVGRARQGGRKEARSGGGEVSELAQVEREIDINKQAAKRQEASERAARERAWKEGARREERVQDRFSAALRDDKEGARGSLVLLK